MRPTRLPQEDLDHVAAQVGGAWEALRGGRVFLTGGTGFFGKWLIETFLHANQALKLQAEMLVLSRDPAAFLEQMPHLAERPDLSFLVGDMGGFAFPESPVSHIIHAAKQVFHPDSGPDRLTILDRDIQGAWRVLEFARHCRAQGVLLTSSGAVYGALPPGMTHVSEDYAGAPDTMNVDASYGHAKRVSELLGAMYHQRHGVPTKIARCFAFIGPHLALDSGFAVASFLGDGLRGGPIVVQGDGSPCRSYLYTADLAAWLWVILLKGECCLPYNVGSEEVVALGELACGIAAEFGPALDVRILREITEGKPVEHYVPSTRRAQSQLGLRAMIGLREAIARTVRWYRSCQ